MADRKKYEKVEDMQKAIDNYFAQCDMDGKPYTVTGLALALGFLSRQALINYEGYTDIDDIKFHDTIKRAKTRIENNVVENMLLGKFNPTGSIFSLKNNFNWRDKQEVENSGTQSMVITVQGDAAAWGK